MIYGGVLARPAEAFNHLRWVFGAAHVGIPQFWLLTTVQIETLMLHETNQLCVSLPEFANVNIFGKTILAMSLELL